VSRKYHREPEKERERERERERCTIGTKKKKKDYSIPTNQIHQNIFTSKKKPAVITSKASYGEFKYNS
jgi:hypothetical protein